MLFEPLVTNSIQLANRAVMVPMTRSRTGAYGRSIEGRNRFALGRTRHAAAIGAHRVGIRLSPYGVFNSTGPFPDVEAQYLALTQELSQLGLLYLHLLDHSAMGAPPVPAELKSRLRAAFQGLFILAGGRSRSCSTCARGRCGRSHRLARPFLAKFRSGAAHASRCNVERRDSH
jgi:N-ethylmaleimide reductase